MNSIFKTIFLNQESLKKKRISLSIVFAIFGLSLAIGMIIWKFTPMDPSWEELRNRILTTPEENPRKCHSVYPMKSLKKKFSVSEVGIPLNLSPFIKEGRYEEAADAAQVKSIFQSVVRLKSLVFTV